MFSAKQPIVQIENPRILDEKNYNYASVCSLKRRIVLLTVTALAVLQIHINRIISILYQCMVLDVRKQVSKELLHGISTTSLDLPTVLASPNSNCFPLHSKLERQYRWY